MGDFLPTRELLQMIEERIPGGRVLTTAALLLGLLAIIVGACAFLYRQLVLPSTSFIVGAIAKGSITTSGLSNILGTIITGIVVYFVLKHLSKHFMKRAEEILEHAHGVLNSNEATLLITHRASEQLAELEARVSRLENPKPGIMDR